DFLHLMTSQRKWFRNPLDACLRTQFRMGIDEILDFLGWCSGADFCRHIKREKIAGCDEPFYGREVDVIGIEKIWFVPPPSRYRRIHHQPAIRWLRTDDLMFSVRLIPNRSELDAKPRGLLKRLELCTRTMGKTITNTERKFGTEFHQF